MTVARWLWLVLAALGIAVLQLTIADELSIAGMHPELIWVLPVAVGLLGGTMPGMAAGFVGGVVADLFQPTPFGLTALVGVLVGYVVGRLGEEGVGDLGGSAFWVAPTVGMAAGFSAPLCYALFGAIGGHHSYLSIDVLVVAALDAAWCALAVRPMMRLLRRRFAGESSRAAALDPVRGAM